MKTSSGKKAAIPIACFLLVCFGLPGCGSNKGIDKPKTFSDAAPNAVEHHMDTEGNKRKK